MPAHNAICVLLAQEVKIQKLPTRNAAGAERAIGEYAIIPSRPCSLTAVL